MSEEKRKLALRTVVDKKPIGGTYTLTANGKTTPPIPYDMSVIDFEKRKLALRLVEHIDSWIQRNGELDVDAAAKDLAVLIPSTRAEAEAEFEELLQDTSTINKNPSAFTQLREALGLKDCSMDVVLKSATQCVLHLDEIRQTPYDAGLFAIKDTCNSWHDYIRYLLQEAHQYYVWRHK